MQWFQIKEQSAGTKRLLLSWYLYKIFGKNVLYLIAFFVSFFTFVFAPKVRNYSKKYFEIIKPYTNLKPSPVNQFKHIYSYAISLVDKMLVYSSDFDSKDVVFADKDIETKLFEDIKKQKGVFFICCHVGNIEIMHSLLADNNSEFNINIFLSNKQSQIFNSFLNSIKREFPVKLFFIEDVGLNTAIELKENLDGGDVVFIAGDRLAENNDIKSIETEMFSHKILLPEGTFRFAKLMEVPVYFISAVKIGNKYQIYAEKQDILSEKELVNAYTKYLEKIILVNPFQFYNFYDFFINQCQ